jgi:antitoxin component of MazEF toxin-antitoxin module
MEAAGMQKKMIRHGNSMALVIEKPILDLLGADAETPFDIMTDGQALVLTPVHDEKRRDAFRFALERGNRKYADALKKLAQ